MDHLIPDKHKITRVAVFQCDQVNERIIQSLWFCSSISGLVKHDLDVKSLLKGLRYFLDFELHNLFGVFKYILMIICLFIKLLVNVLITWFSEETGFLELSLVFYFCKMPGCVV